jgi:putative restriction endonuclease
VLGLVKQRLRQASFREVVLSVYDHRCAISSLPEDHLLDAAHIMADSDELLGQPVIANGIALSKIHHAAFRQPPDRQPKGRQYRDRLAARFELFRRAA